MGTGRGPVAGTALAFLLIEHGWAQPLFDAIAETGGALLGEGFLTSEAGLLVGAEVAAMEAAATVIAAAQAAETHALLLALAADTHAAESMAASEAIGGAAAARAIQALITAGLVEEAAAHEAVDALIAAGLIVAAADEAAAEAVAEGAATIKAASITMAQALVLRYLPTQLTFAVIAEKLGISRAAAKERAERAYKNSGSTAAPKQSPGPERSASSTNRHARPRRRDVLFVPADRFSRLQNDAEPARTRARGSATDASCRAESSRGPNSRRSSERTSSTTR